MELVAHLSFHVLSAPTSKMPPAAYPLIAPQVTKKIYPSTNKPARHFDRRTTTIARDAMEASSKRRKLDHVDSGLHHGGLIDFESRNSARVSTASNFVLQTDELLKGAKLRYSKALKHVDAQLHRLKGIIESIEPHEPTPVRISCLTEPGIFLTFADWRRDSQLREEASHNRAVPRPPTLERCAVQIVFREACAMQCRRKLRVKDNGQDSGSIGC